MDYWEAKFDLIKGEVDGEKGREEKAEVEKEGLKSESKGEELETKKEHIVGRELKPRNSDFYQNDFLSRWEYSPHGTHSVKFSYL